MVAYDELGSLVPIKRTLQVIDYQNHVNKESEVRAAPVPIPWTCECFQLVTGDFGLWVCESLGTVVEKLMIGRRVCIPCLRANIHLSR